MARKRTRKSNKFDSEGSIQAFLNEASRYKPLTDEEEQSLAVRCVAGDRAAMNKLVKHNLLFVIKEAVRQSTSSVAAEDLVQEGIMGMFHAAEKFSPEGVRFISYATHWSRSCMQRFVRNKGSAVRFPVHLANTAADVRRFASMGGDVEQALPEEIRAVARGDKRGHTDFCIEQAKRSMRPISSLNEPLSEGGDAEHQDFIASEMPDPDDFIGPYSALSALDIAMEVLSERQRDMVIRYYIPPDGEHETLFQIGARHGLSSERVRQLILEAFRMMRAKHNNLLADALGEDKYKVWWNEGVEKHEE